MDSHPELARQLINTMGPLLEKIASAREINIKDVYETFDINEDSKKTLEELRALGYIK